MDEIDTLFERQRPNEKSHHSWNASKPSSQNYFVGKKAHDGECELFKKGNQLLTPDAKVSSSQAVSI
jgi:hypothetical protein